VETVSYKVVRHSLAYLSVQKWLVRDVPFYVKIWPKLIHPFKNANLQSIFASSASAVTPGKNSLIYTNRKFTTSFWISSRWTVYVDSKPPRGLKNELVLMTNKNMGFRLIPIGPLNDLERRKSPYFALFHLIRWLWRPITSQWLQIDQWCLQNIVFHFWPNLTDASVARSLCDSWATWYRR